jgi:topoisomerase-4 subunit B
LLRVDALDLSATDGVLVQLMGRNEAAARRDLMERRGDEVEVDI